MSDIISKYNTEMNNVPRIKQQNVTPATTKINLLAQYNSTNNSIEYKMADGSIFFSIDLTNGVVNLGTVDHPSGNVGTLIGPSGGTTGAKVAFFGTTPIVQPLLATGTGKTVDNVITVLQSLGLVRQT